jgi:pimeloyl-ACP methyl ester carboxylesterase
VPKSRFTIQNTTIVMNTGSRRYTLNTSHGQIAVREWGRGSYPVVMIHGNSSCHEVFRPQWEGPLAKTHRLIAFDLPGHGLSANAIDPARTYTRPGFADVAIEVLQRLGLSSPVLLGWSLGGHVALEMASRLPELRGVMICGTPPVGAMMSEGFNPKSEVKYGAMEHLSLADIEAFGSAILGASFDATLRDAMRRADGLARKTLFEAARAGAGVDQRWVVENVATPLAVVNGADDGIVNLDYVDSLNYARLWSGRCHRLAGAGHAAFRESPIAFNALLGKFLADIAAGDA